MRSWWDRLREWFGAAPRPEYDVNRAPGDDKARRAMYPELTDAEYEAMARRNGWR